METQNPLSSFSVMSPVHARNQIERTS